MSFNADYMYGHLPARVRKADAAQGLPLRRMLDAVCADLDEYDRLFETFHEQISPDTATEEFIKWWLWSLFGWAWEPVFFTDVQRRDFYRHIARHYARRGTKRGIEEFLAAFGLTARVTNSPLFWGEWSFGEDEWFITEANGIVVQIFPVTGAVVEDLTFWGEFAWGDDYPASAALVPTRADIDGLLRFQWPLGHIIVVEDKVAA
jgi:hypothetical protein